MEIKTIDLWTEQYKNHYECFNGAFVDGFEKNKIPFNRYKVVKNCNCIITTNRKDINITNKHNAIVFYYNNKPVRLMVINKDTQIENCINIALKQRFNNIELKDLYEKENIKVSIVDMQEQSIYNNSDSTKEIDVGSCDRWNLLYNMLKGSYTEDDTPYGNFQSDKYEFVPNIIIKYELKTDTENFNIEHNCAFINEIKTRIIPIQENSKLTKN
ncbi:MAG: hypothetical protein ACI4VE_03440 [Clostridia bacterium]